MLGMGDQRDHIFKNHSESCFYAHVIAFKKWSLIAE
jgi:hypothetical protein